mmetsp:Transcript_31972/g.73354  ORF Transcript_31972/g.73354 Transcript_31972/m.73354 type:complete len:138 (-) Transcript_31972:119-532(-)
MAANAMASMTAHTASSSTMGLDNTPGTASAVATAPECLASLSCLLGGAPAMRRAPGPLPPPLLLLLPGAELARERKQRKQDVDSVAAAAAEAEARETEQAKPDRAATAAEAEARACAEAQKIRTFLVGTLFQVTADT